VRKLILSTSKSEGEERERESLCNYITITGRRQRAITAIEIRRGLCCSVGLTDLFTSVVNLKSVQRSPATLRGLTLSYNY
jgi:hypothetical protein